MLTRPPMLILDEATSSIDTRTEMRVQDAFQKLMQGRTCFIVAHRLSTIENADLILVMKAGTIIEQGDAQRAPSNGRLLCRALQGAVCRVKNFAKIFLLTQKSFREERTLLILTSGFAREL